jgi:hypothetical protein
VDRARITALADRLIDAYHRAVTLEPRVRIQVKENLA